MLTEIDFALNSTSFGEYCTCAEPCWFISLFLKDFAGGGFNYHMTAECFHTFSQQKIKVQHSVFLFSGKTKTDYDVVIVGGGIVGMATAQELITQHPNLSFAVVEKEPELGIDFVIVVFKNLGIECKHTG